MSFACGLLGKCHSLSAEQRSPVRVMYHLETGVSARPVAILSHPDGMLQPHPETSRWESGVSLHFLRICPSRFQRNPSQVQALLLTMPGEILGLKKRLPS